jgi:CRP-like cAMP-binding protein
VTLRIWPADLSGSPLLKKINFSLDCTITEGICEIKVGIGRNEARYKANPGESPTGYLTRSASLRDGHTGFVPWSSPRQPEIGPPTPPDDQITQPGACRPGVRQEQPRRTAGKANAMVNFWDSLNADQRRAFQAKAQSRIFARGARLMREGEEGSHVAVIRSGLTEVRVSENGIERVVAVRGPGQLIGERAALEVNPRSATVVALQTVMALVVSTADFAAFVSTYPAVLKIVENQIFTRLREGRVDQDPADGQLAFAWAGSLPASQAPPRLTGQHCTVIRSDVVAFGAAGRDAEAHKIIKKALPVMTQLSLGPIWNTCRCEDRGDGLLIIVSPEFPTAQVIERLVTMLPPQLRRHNLTYSAASQMQLRLAIEVGPIEDTEFGVTGRSIIGVSRILDAAVFKHAIATQGATLGVIVSPFVYETCIMPGSGCLDPADFTEVPVHVKETHGSAWMQMIRPGGGRLSRRPGPVSHLREVLALLAGVRAGLDALVGHQLADVAGRGGQPGDPVDHVHHQVVPVQVVQHDHVEGRGGGALLLVPADVEVGVPGAAVGQPVDERRVAVVGEDDRGGRW